MQYLSIVILALGQVCSLAFGAIANADIRRAAVDASVLHVNGLQINVATIPVTQSRLDHLANVTGHARSPVPETTLAKRAVNNCCFDGCRTTCVDGLSTSPDKPLESDCLALRDAVDALGLTKLTTTFPCNLPRQASCPTFTVAPGFERAYWLGTCLVGFINLNPTGGASESFCDYLMAGTLMGIFDNCVTTSNMTGGLCIQDLQPGRHYALEVRHV